jgi:hypothetical protein
VLRRSIADLAQRRIAGRHRQPARTRADCSGDRRGSPVGAGSVRSGRRFTGWQRGHVIVRAVRSSCPHAPGYWACVAGLPGIGFGEGLRALVSNARMETRTMFLSKLAVPAAVAVRATVGHVVRPDDRSRTLELFAGIAAIVVKDKRPRAKRNGCVPQSCGTTSLTGLSQDVDPAGHLATEKMGCQKLRGQKRIEMKY